MNLFFIWACLAYLSFANAKSKDYCKLNCGEKINIACNFTGGFDETCSGTPKVYYLNKKENWRYKILDKHNELRAVMASASESYDDDVAATKMLTMKWSNKLAKMAERTARKCSNAYGWCHKTDIFNNPGQNICFHEIKNGDDIKPEVVMQICLEEWEDTFNMTNNLKAVLASFPEPTNGLEHPSAPFARMILERNGLIGCSMSKFKLKIDENSEAANEYYLFVCTYLFDVEPGKAVYEADFRPGRKCIEGSREFPSLCHEHDTDAFLSSMSYRE